MLLSPIINYFNYLSSFWPIGSFWHCQRSLLVDTLSLLGHHFPGFLHGLVFWLSFASFLSSLQLIKVTVLQGIVLGHLLFSAAISMISFRSMFLNIIYLPMISTFVSPAWNSSLNLSQISNCLFHTFTWVSTWPLKFNIPKTEFLRSPPPQSKPASPF